jgi:hypothetical protein
MGTVLQLRLLPVNKQCADFISDARSLNMILRLCVSYMVLYGVVDLGLRLAERLCCWNLAGM